MTLYSLGQLPGVNYAPNPKGGQNWPITEGKLGLFLTKKKKKIENAREKKRLY